ncbi:MAG: HD family phosphohydrolase [Bacteroidia bacterium]
MSFYTNIKTLFRRFVASRRHSFNLANRVMLLGGFVIAVTLILPRQRVLDFQYEVGRSWESADLVAEFDFPVFKGENEVLALKEKAKSDVLQVYTRDTSVESQVENAFGTHLFRLLEEQKRLASAKLRGDTLSYKGLLKQSSFLKFDLDPLGFVADTGKVLPVWYEKASTQGRATIARVYGESMGVIVGKRDTFSAFINVQNTAGASKALPASAFAFEYEIDKKLLETSSEVSAERLGALVLEQYIEPDLLYNPLLTRREQNRISSLITPISGFFEKGRTIIGRGDLVNEQAYRRIQSYLREGERVLDTKNWLQQVLSQMLVVFLLIGILIIYLRVNQPRLYFDTSKLGLILTTLFLTVLAMVLTLQLEQIIGRTPRAISFIYLAPTCMAAVLLSNFFDSRTGFIANLIAALFGAVLIQRGLGFAFVQIIAGTVAIYSLRRLRDRRVFFYTLIYVLVAYVVSFFAYELFSKGNLHTIHYETIILLVFNVALTFLAYPSVYAFERLFGVTSDLAFLELLDTNHPLLHKLARRAPGTFQHSLQVANLAESLVQVLGGNPLLTHVGALYHDIGKLKNPDYFIENSNLEDTPHKRIHCTESAKIIIDHVKDGVKMAEKHHLPREIINFIETHHGTTRVEYFYRQYQKEPDCTNPEDDRAFRYPGPRPFTKEGAALMIADSIEAASRTLKVYTEEALFNLVNGIIDYKIKDGQLENAPVTFKDLAIIRKVMHKQLLTMYHARIEYPEEE